MENNQAINVGVEVTIDHINLGRLFAEWTNEEQSDFLLGMFLGLQDLGGLYQGIQLQLVMEHAEQNGRVRDLEELADLFNHYFTTNTEK